MGFFDKLKALPVIKNLFKGKPLKEKDGVGVLENGMPYLNLSQVARYCGVSEEEIADIVNTWSSWKTTSGGISLKKYLDQGQFDEENIVILLDGKDDPVFPVTVCTALIHYYADKGNEIAKKNIRISTELTLTNIIYRHVDYFPYGEAPHKAYFERVNLNKSNVPEGYFGIFHENSNMVLRLFDMGIIADEHTVPDISVGMAWSKYWKANGLENKYGPAQKYNHVYPESYPQSAVNNYPSNCYPEDALGEFRRWHRDAYMKQTYPKYIQNKLKTLDLPNYQKALIESKIAKA